MCSRKCCSLTSRGSSISPCSLVQGGPSEGWARTREYNAVRIENHDEGKEREREGRKKAPPSFLRTPPAVQRLRCRPCVYPKDQLKKSICHKRRTSRLNPARSTYFNLDKTRQSNTQNSQITIVNSLTSKNRQGKTAADVLLPHLKIQLR
jgi:hypothetical protein